MSKNKKNKEWMIYPEVSFTMDDIVNHLKMSNTNEKNESLLPEVNNLNENLLSDEILTEEEVTDGLNNSEERELTEEELKELYIQQLKNSKIKFQPLKHPVKKVGTHVEFSSIGRKKIVRDTVVVKNETINPYGAAYKKARKKKAKAVKASRKINRNK